MIRDFLPGWVYALGRLWARLIEPAVPLEDKDLWQQSRLLASLLLGSGVGLLLLSPGYLFANHLPPQEDFQFINSLITAFALFVFYAFSRYGYYSFSSKGVMVFGTAIILYNSTLIGGQKSIHVLYFLVSIIIFSSLFLSLRMSLLVIIFHAIALLLIAPYIPGVSVETVLGGPFIFNVLIDIIFLLAAYHWRHSESERRKLLEASEERYRTISEIMSDYAVSLKVQPDGSFVREWVTDSITRITGYSMEELDNLPLFNFYHPDESQRLKVDLQRVLAGEADEEDYRAVRKDGQRRWLRVVRRPIWDEAHARVTGIYSIVEDITERKQAEVALRISEERYRLISEMISDFAYAYDVEPDNNLILAWGTDALIRLTGYTWDEMLALPRSLFYHPDHFDQVNEDIANNLRGYPVAGEYKVVRKDGVVIWMHISRQPVWDEQEKRVVRIYGIAKDITEAKQAELALRMSEERYRQISEMISDYAFSYKVQPDKRLSLEWGTDSLQRVLGYTWDEYHALPERSLYHPLDLPLVQADHEKNLQGISTESEYRAFRKTGGLIWLRVSRQPRWDMEENRVAGIYGVAKDISAHKQTELALRVSEERYRLISEMISDYAFSCEVKSNGTLAFEWMTDSVAHITGYTAEEIMVHGQFATYHHDDVSKAELDVAKVLNGEHADREYRIITKSGDTRWIHMYRHPIWDKQEKRVVRFYAVAQDITQRKYTEAQSLRWAVEHERTTLISQFVRAFSHDFRTALATIETSGYLLGRSLPAAAREQAETRLERIRSSIQHMSEQLDNLDTVSSLSNAPTIPCQVNDVLADVIHQYSTLASQRKQELIFSPADGLPTLYLDESKIQIAVKHLLVNAVTHTPERGQIRLSTFQQDNHIVIEIVDTGEGIAPEQLASIFEPFYKVDPSRKLEWGGIGLGLSIVKMIVEAHAGNVTVASEPGKGACFRLHLPIAFNQTSHLLSEAVTKQGTI